VTAEAPAARLLPKETFRDQVAIVTGGGTGIGKVIARTLAQAGAKVVIASRKQDVLDQAVAALSSEGLTARAIATDIRDPAQVDALVKGTLDAFGRLDVLVNNAAGNFVVQAEELSPNGFRSVVDIVLNGTFLCSRAAGRHWLEKDLPGSIVNVIAAYAWTGAPGVVHSAAAKAGVWNMTMTLAAEWGPRKIRVNSVAPGIVVTEGASKNLGYDDPTVQKALTSLIPSRRLATSEEVADAVAYLASPFASYVNGTCLTIDGGATLNRGLIGMMEDVALRVK
jgi:NAD(P)-dependent dehydrogenase (short-subunit alcohol dehydrogenase family)